MSSINNNSSTYSKGTDTWRSLYPVWCEAFASLW